MKISHQNIYAKTFKTLLIASSISLLTIGSSFAEEGPLKINKGGLFEEPTYQLSSDAPVKLNDGMDFSDQFKKTLALHPAALAEAEHANSVRPIVLTGSLVMLAGTIVMLKDSLDQADDPLGEDPDYSKPLGLVIAGGVIALIGGSQFKGHLDKAVELYNNAEKSGSTLGKSTANEYINPSYKQTRLNMGFNLDIPKYRLNETQTQADDIALVGNIQYRF